MEIGSGSGGEVSKVDKQKLMACMKCPLCNDLFNEATTISECLHTFCRKCIYEKLTEEMLRVCPVCKIDLGCAPLEKLRTDNNLQDIRIKLFPSKQRILKEPEGTSVVPSQIRRKETPLSSRVISTPRVSTKSSLTGRRSKLTPRKALTRQESPRKEECVSKLEEPPKNLSSPDKYSKVVQNRMQNFSVGEPSKQHVLDRSTGSISKALEDKADLWKPFNRPVEPASGTNPNKIRFQQNATKPAPHSLNNEVNMHTVKESGNGSMVPGKENCSTPERSTSVRPRRSQGIKQKREATSERLNISAQPVVDSRSKYDGRRLVPIWFSLVSSKSQDGLAPLPQIFPSYLRVKDGNLLVSTIKKYLVRKLGLPSETKVDITFQGQPLRSKLQLHKLVEWWMQTTPTSQRVQTFAGSSAKDHVIGLSYSLQARPKKAILALEATNRRWKG